MSLKKIWKILISLCIIVVIVFVIIVGIKKFVFKDDYYVTILEQAKEYQIDPYLILAIIKTESNFNSNAISTKGAVGLMQILPSTYQDMINRDIDAQQLYDPTINISIGIKYFNFLLNKFDDNQYLAVLAYNAGIGKVKSWIENNFIPSDLNTHVEDSIPYQESKLYLERVMNNYKIYQLLY